jgi:replication factor C subunit 1
MFTIKYKPTVIENFVGNKQLILPFIKWLNAWNANDDKKKCALISGICGIGKSLFVELIMKKYNYNIINFDNDNVNTVSFKTITGQNNILIASDIDNYICILNIIDVIKKSKIPVVCICDNKYNQSIKPILSFCIHFNLLKPTYQEVYRFIKNIVENEKINIENSTIKNLYEQSNGDIRSILNNLQFGCKAISKNIQSTNIFDTTAILLSMNEPLNIKYETYWLFYDLHPLMVHENYIMNTIGIKDPACVQENLSYSADALSYFDLCEIDQYNAYYTLMSSSKCNKKGLIQFPQKLGKLSTINKNIKENINKKYTQTQKPKLKAKRKKQNK